MVYNIVYKVKHHRKSFSLIYFYLLGKACIRLCFTCETKDKKKPKRLENSQLLRKT